MRTRTALAAIVCCFTLTAAAPQRHCTAPTGNVLTIGDSRLSTNQAETALASLYKQHNLRNIDPDFDQTISGQSAQSYLSNKRNTRLLRKADTVVINLGINDHWSTHPAENFETLITHVSRKNRRATIWVFGEYTNRDLLNNYFSASSAESIHDASVQIAAAQTVLADDGAICLVGWTELASTPGSAEHEAYLTASPADGVHMFGNYDVYVGALSAAWNN